VCKGVGQFARSTGYWCATCLFHSAASTQTLQPLRGRKLCRVDRCGHASRREKKYEGYCKQCFSDRHAEPWQWCSSCTKRVAVPGRKHGQCLDCATARPRPSKTCTHRLLQQLDDSTPRACQVQLLDAAGCRFMLLEQQLGVRPASSRMTWARAPPQLFIGDGAESCGVTVRFATSEHTRATVRTVTFPWPSVCCRAFLEAAEETLRLGGFGTVAWSEPLFARNARKRYC